MKRKRSIYNIAIGIISQLIAISLGIVIPRLFLVSFGSEMNGLLNSIGQVLGYLALLEAGVGAASLQALYKPISCNDNNEICRILASTNKYYHKTGIIYLIALVLMSLIYPFVIKTDIEFFTITIIIVMNGLPSVVSYLFQGKYVILLQAEGKNYINTALTSITSTLISIAKIALLLIGCNIIVIQLSYFLISMSKVLFIALYIKKNYTWIDLSERPNYEAISQKNAALVNQICDLVFRNADIVILSLFCDLKVVSVYAVYSLLFSMIRTALDTVSKGFDFIMGQTYNRDPRNYVVLHDLYETYRIALIFALYNIAIVFIIPFLRLYTAGVADVYYFDYTIALLFVVTFVLSGARACSADLINYAQHFKLTQSRCVIEAVIKITVSIALVYRLGIHGVLIGTIVALVYRANDMVLYANRRLLKRGVWIVYRKWIINSILFTAITITTSILPWNLSSYLNILGWACISGLVIVLLYFLIASVVDKGSYRAFKSYIKSLSVKLQTLN